jgi:hypothetical protein
VVAEPSLSVIGAIACVAPGHGPGLKHVANTPSTQTHSTGSPPGFRASRFAPVSECPEKHDEIFLFLARQLGAEARLKNSTVSSRVRSRPWTTG